jgi:NADPH-dependent F420 reductase
MAAKMSPVALLGGTGRSGPGLALRFAMAGVDIVIGSRDAAKGVEAAAKISERLVARGGEAGTVTGHTNADAAELAETVFITVPYEGQAALLRDLAPALRGRTVVSTVVPMRWDPELGPVGIEVAEGSAAEEAAALLPGASVVAGYHSLSSAVLIKPDRAVTGDVIVTGDDAGAKRIAMDLAELIEGVRSVDGGALRCARYSEGLTVLLLSINRIYKAHSGVVITDLPER